MKILIGICTRNRNSLLQKNLYSLRKLYIPKFVNLSILVVDNTKNAASNKLIKEFQKNSDSRCPKSKNTIHKILSSGIKIFILTFLKF